MLCQHFGLIMLATSMAEGHRGTQLHTASFGSQRPLLPLRQPTAFLPAHTCACHCAGIGGDLPVKKDMRRFVKWPKYVRIQRQRRVLNQRLKVGMRGGRRCVCTARHGPGRALLGAAVAAAGRWQEAPLLALSPARPPSCQRGAAASGGSPAESTACQYNWQQRHEKLRAEAVIFLRMPRCERQRGTRHASAEQCCMTASCR